MSVALEITDSTWLKNRFAGITRADVAELADRYQVPGWRAIVADVQAATARWPEFAAAANLDAATAAMVATDIATLAPR